MAQQELPLAILMFEIIQILLTSWSFVHTSSNNEIKLISSFAEQKGMIFLFFATVVHLMVVCVVGIAVIIACFKMEDQIVPVLRVWTKGSYFLILNQCIIILLTFGVGWSDKNVGFTSKRPVVVCAILVNCENLLIRVLGMVVAFALISAKISSKGQVTNGDIMDYRQDFVSGNAIDIGGLQTSGI